MILRRNVKGSFLRRGVWRVEVRRSVSRGLSSQFFQVSGLCDLVQLEGFFFSVFVEKRQWFKFQYVKIQCLFLYLQQCGFNFFRSVGFLQSFGCVGFEFQFRRFGCSRGLRIEYFFSFFFLEDREVQEVFVIKFIVQERVNLEFQQVVFLERI